MKTGLMVSAPFTDASGQPTELEEHLEILKSWGLNTLDIGQAVTGGLGIVLIAIILDRITQGMAQKK